MLASSITERIAYLFHLRGILHFVMTVVAVQEPHRLTNVGVELLRIRPHQISRLGYPTLLVWPQGLSNHKSTPCRSRSAAISQYFSSISIPIPRLPRSLQARRVVPLPMKGSRTVCAPVHSI